MPPSKIMQASAPRSPSRQELDDGVAADLLLTVEGDPDVHRQPALARKLLGGLQEEIGVPLVVDRPATVDPAVAHDRLERRRLPELERIRRLDVEVAIEEHCRRIRSTARCGDLTDGERLLIRVDQRGVTAGAAHKFTEPLARSPNVSSVSWIGTDARNPNPLEQLVEPSRIGLAGHGAHLTEGRK